MAKTPSKSFREPLRRSGRIRARNAMIDTMNLVSDDGGNVEHVEQALPKSRRGIKREIVEDRPLDNRADEPREDQSSTNFMESSEEGESDNNSDAPAIPTAKWQGLPKTRNDASISGLNGFGHPGRREGPLLKLPKPQLLSFPLPTISEMLAAPAGVPTLEQQPIDLEKCDHRKHLKRSPSREWSQGGSPPPGECGSGYEGADMCNVPVKRFRRNYGSRFQNLNSGGTTVPRCTPLPTRKKQPSCRNSRSNGSESDSENEIEGDDELSGSSVNNEFDHSTSTKQTVKKSKLSSKKEKIHKKVRPSRAKTVCRTCGGEGHRNIIDDRTKDTISRALFRHGLSDQEQPKATKSRRIH